MFDDLLKAAVGTVLLPVKAVADVVTMGGVLSDKDKPYTVEGCEEIMDNLSNATKPKE